MKLKSISLYFYIFTFYTFSSSASAQDLLKLIPADASGVVTINGGSFFKKFDLDQINRLDIFQDQDKKNAEIKGSKFKEYSKIYKDPASLGLNILTKSYLYFNKSKDTTEYGTNYTFSGLIMPLSKSKKFESFIKKISESPIVKAGNYKYCSFSNSGIVAWNNEHMILLFLSQLWSEKPGLVREELNRVLSLPADQCIKNNKNFMTTQAQTSDFNYWLNFESMIMGVLPMSYMALPLYKELPFIGSDFYKEYFLQMNIDFNKGNIAIDATQTLSDESASKIKGIYGKGLNPEFMKYIHKDHLLGMYTYSLNMKSIKPMLDTALTDSLKTNLNEGFIELLYANKIQKDPKIKKLQAEIDSMYTDLYPAVVDSELYGVDTNSAEQEYYLDSIATEEQYNLDTVSTEEYFNPDSTYTYEYSAEQVKEDSIYEAKNSRIDIKNKEKDSRKEAILQKKSKELKLSKDYLFDLFQGDVMGGITDIRFRDITYKSFEFTEDFKSIEVEKTRKDPYPEFILGFTLDNVGKGNKLMEKLIKDSVLLKVNNYYEVAALWSTNVFMVISNNLLLITNNEDLLKNNLNGYPQEERISKDVQDLLLNKTSSIYVNLKDIFSKFPNDSLSGNDHEIYSVLTNSLQILSATSNQYNNNISHSDMSLQFANKTNNSFYEIFRIANEVYKIYKKNIKLE